MPKTVVLGENLRKLAGKGIQTLMSVSGCGGVRILDSVCLNSLSAPSTVHIGACLGRFASIASSPSLDTLELPSVPAGSPTYSM